MGAAVLGVFMTLILIIGVACLCRAHRRNQAKMEDSYMKDMNETIFMNEDEVGRDSPVFESRFVIGGKSESDEASAETSGIGSSKSSKESSSSSDSPGISPSKYL